MIKKQNDNFRVSDLFKDGTKPAKVRGTNEEYLNSLHIYANQMNTSTTIRNYINDFSKLVADDEILSARLVDPASKQAYDFNITLNNRMQRFTYAHTGKLYDYKEVLGIEAIAGEGYLNLKQQGYNNFYNLYVKFSEYAPEEKKILCVLAFKK